MTKSELCLKCQACCKLLEFQIPTDQNAISFYESRGLEVKMMSFPNLKITTTVIIPHIYQHLTPQGCAIYESRPLACRIFDGTKSPETKDVCLWNSFPRSSSITPEYKQAQRNMNKLRSEAIKKMSKNQGKIYDPFGNGKINFDPINFGVIRVKTNKGENE